MDTKLKNNKIGKNILFFIIVVSLALVLLQFKSNDNWAYIRHNKEFYKSMSFNEYIREKVETIYEVADRKDFNNYNIKIKSLNEEKNMKYIAVNNYTKEVQSNTQYKSISDFKNNEKGYVEIEGENFTFNMKIDNEEFNYNENINNRERINIFRGSFGRHENIVATEEVKHLSNESTPVSIYAVLPEIPREADTLRRIYLENKSVYKMKKYMGVISLLGAIIFIATIAIRKKLEYKFINNHSQLYKSYSKIALEFKLILIMIPIVLDKSLKFYEFRPDLNSNVSTLTIIPIDVIVSLLLKAIYIISTYMIIKNIKYGNILKNSISYKVFKVIRKNVKSTIIASRKIGLIKRTLILSFISIILVNIVLFLLILVSGIHGYTMVITTLIVSSMSFVIFTAYIVFKLGYLNEIMEGVNKIENGDINYKIEVKGNDSFTSLAESINNIGNGLDNAIEERMKSETMKSELITNVSHDLKTPLTSILNYVDLLKQEEVKPEHLNDYIAILDQKSKRLKILIEDLFEAAKATSGTVELNIEKIQLNQLLTQSIAEMEGKIEESNLDMKVNFPENKVYINADGKKLFRVFENLISNIVKYSLKCTRVYIDFYINDDYAYITFKNISAYELNFNEGEITERFKRGDTSRSEEGSGLGLSIAKGLVELQGGEFTVQTDGDLFKAIVKLQLSKEQFI